jgi:hypothetical protein
MAKVSKKSDTEATCIQDDRELVSRAQAIVDDKKLSGLIVHLWLEQHEYVLAENNTQE